VARATRFTPNHHSNHRSRNRDDRHPSAIAFKYTPPYPECEIASFAAASETFLSPRPNVLIPKRFALRSRGNPAARPWNNAKIVALPRGTHEGGNGDWLGLTLCTTLSFAALPGLRFRDLTPFLPCNGEFSSDQPYSAVTPLFFLRYLNQPFSPVRESSNRLLEIRPPSERC
jgi:hypothetical protein